MVYDIVKASPSGYNRDLQEAKEPFIDGISNDSFIVDNYVCNNK